MPAFFLPEKISTLDGLPPPLSSNWPDFFHDHCELRDWCQNVVLYGWGEYSYILFPCGTVIVQHGYHGATTMGHIRDTGRDFVLQTIKHSFERQPVNGPEPAPATP